MAMSAPELVGAIAASAAAVLSGITLWFTAHRDERRWRRDALVDTLVQLLDASFALPDTVAFEARRTGKDLESVRDAARVAHDQLVSALTRLRVLASTTVVEKAEALHSMDDAAIDVVLSHDATPLPSIEEWRNLVDRRRAARTDLLSASRKSLGLGPARPLERGRARPSGI
jgi:hypothetical protein